MATELILEKNAQGRLVAADGMSEEAINDLPAGKPLGVTVRQKRNLKHHRKYWALIRAVFAHQALYPTERLLSKGIKRAAGLTDEVLNVETMEYETDVGSIAFDKMEQGEFEQFYERAVEIVLTRIIPAVCRGDLEEQVQEILGGRSK